MAVAWAAEPPQAVTAKGDIAWRFYFRMIQDGLLADQLADPENPTWVSARRWIDRSFNTTKEDFETLYLNWKRHIVLPAQGQ